MCKWMLFVSILPSFLPSAPMPTFAPPPLRATPAQTPLPGWIASEAATSLFPLSGGKLIPNVLQLIRSRYCVSLKEPGCGQPGPGPPTPPSSSFLFFFFLCPCVTSPVSKHFLMQRVSPFDAERHCAHSLEEQSRSGSAMRRASPSLRLTRPFTSRKSTAVSFCFGGGEGGGGKVRNYQRLRALGPGD